MYKYNLKASADKWSELVCGFIKIAGYKVHVERSSVYLKTSYKLEDKRVKDIFNNVNIIKCLRKIKGV